MKLAEYIVYRDLGITYDFFPKNYKYFQTIRIEEVTQTYRKNN
jgi:hypothetical protein